MATKKKNRFTAEDVGSWEYVRAGTSSAADLDLIDEDVSCVNCGAPLTHVFVTEVGPMGGDCLASITGDDSTRKVVQKMQRERSKFYWILDNLRDLKVETLDRGRSACFSGYRWDDGKYHVVGCYNTPNVVLVAAAAQGLLDAVARERNKVAPQIKVVLPRLS